MAVYKQTYRGYAGPLMPARGRMFIVYRYAGRAIFQSKLLLAFFVISFLLPLLGVVTVYVAHNPKFLAYLRITHFLAINRSFFYAFLHYQCFMAFLFTAFAAPGLIAPDLAHGGLTVLLARPLRRREYLLGKILVLWVLLSALTWAPGLLLFAEQWDLAGAAWGWSHLWLAWGIAASALIWIAVLSLVALALSVWVKWRVAAGAALLGLYFFGAGLGWAIDFVLSTSNGSLLDFMGLHLIVWRGFFRLSPPPLALEGEAWAVLAALAIAAAALILRKVRPLEVVT